MPLRTDTSRPTSIPSPWASFGWLASVLLACSHFALLDIERSTPFLNLRLYASGGERLPYQGRILMSWLLEATAGNPRIAPGLIRLATRIHLPAQVADPFSFILLLTNLAAMLIAIFAARATLLYLTGNRTFASWASLLMLYMAYFNLLTVYGLTYTLPYDVPALALFSLGVWLVISRRYWLLLPVFVLGTLNRETFCFLTLFLALYTWFGASAEAAGNRNSSIMALRRVAPHLLLQTLVWVAMRLWVHHHFLHNPTDAGAKNGLFEFQFAHNLKMIANPAQWPLFLSLFGFTLPFVLRSHRWIGDRALAQSVAIVAFLWTVAMLIIGVIIEIRIFDELTAFLVPLLGLILWNRWILPAARAEQPTAPQLAVSTL